MYGLGMVLTIPTSKLHPSIQIVVSLIFIICILLGKSPRYLKRILKKNLSNRQEFDYFSALICRYDMSPTTNRKIMHDPVS